MADLASPRKVIGAYKTSVLPQMEDNYETDPSKLGDTTTLTGALGGLAKGGINLLANAAGRSFNAVTAYTPPQASAAGFADRNTKRYAPQGVAPAAPAPQGVRTLQAAHTPGQVLSKGLPSQGASMAPLRATAGGAPLGAGIRRPASRPLPESNPTVTWDEQNAASQEQGGTADQGYIEQGGIKMYVPGSKAADQPGISTMGAAAFDAPAPAARLYPGDVGYMGSQQETEDDYANDKIFRNPFPFKTAAARTAQQVQQETAQNNAKVFGTTLMKTQADVQHLGTEDNQINTLLPVKVAEGKAGIRKSAAETSNLLATGAEIAPNAASERTYRTKLGNAAESGASVLLAEAPSKVALYDSEVAKNRSAVENNPTKREIAAEKNATAVQLAQEKAEAPIREAALAAAPVAGVPVEQALAAVKMGLVAKKKTMFRKAGFYDAQGNRVDTSKLAGVAPQVAPKGVQARVNGKIVTSDGAGGWL